MDAQERRRLQDIYEKEMPEEDLAELAMVEQNEFDPGVHELVMEAVRKRGLIDKLEEVKRGERQAVNDEKWVQIYEYNDDPEREVLESFFKDKKIPIDVISKERSAMDGLTKSSSGLGIIRVKETDVQKAEKVIEEFQKTHDTAQEEEELVIATINEILSKRGVDDSLDIARQIHRAVNDLYS